MPIKMNIGSATSTQFFMTSQTRFALRDVYAQSTPIAKPRSISRTMAITVNTIARPPSTQATANPDKISPINETNIRIASASLIDIAWPTEQIRCRTREPTSPGDQ